MFERGRIYRRRDLHARFGGQQQGGISTPSNHPLIFAFTGDTGELYGYKDGWDSDGTFRYSGEGQLGDMAFVRGNRSLLDHAANGRDIHLFERTSKAFVRYLGQMVCAGYDYVPEVPDRNGNPRTAIVFRLIPIDALQPGMEDGDDTLATGDDEASAASLWTRPVDEVDHLATLGPVATSEPGQALRNVYVRSAAVRIVVLRRAEGHCEGCGVAAPFDTPDGRPYLEAHHTRRVSDGGPDHPLHVIALCPTCHRRAHFSSDADAFNNGLVDTLRQLY